jgi:hypothetical protein
LALLALDSSLGFLPSLTVFGPSRHICNGADCSPSKEWLGSMRYRAHRSGSSKELRLSLRLYGTRPEENPVAEAARAEVREHLMQALRWGLAFFVVWGIGMLIGLLWLS